jgi:hypothetical protein
MTLGDAIVHAHARGDHEERNRLLTAARAYGVTVGAMCSLLGVARATAWAWSGGKHDRDSTALSGVLTPNPSSAGARILLEIAEIGPATRQRPGPRHQETRS